MKKDTIRALWVYGGAMARGGIESFIMDNLRSSVGKGIVIDVLELSPNDGVFDEEIKSIGGKCFHTTIPPTLKNYSKINREVTKIMRDGGYNIVHAHADLLDCIPMYCAKKAKIQIRIAHSHNTRAVGFGNKETIKSRILHFFQRKTILMNANCLMACSTMAGRFLFGKKPKIPVITWPDPINVEKFAYNENFRKIIRSDLKISENDLAIGCVARLDINQKNQIFLLYVLSELQKKQNNVHLILVGSGPDKERLNDASVKMGCKNVHFVESTSDVNHYYSAFDVFVMPSNFEGFGMAAIEATANGLKCIVSENVPKDIDVAKNITFLDTSTCESYKKWSEEIQKAAKKRDSKLQMTLSATGFNIKNEVQLLVKEYQKLLN